MGEPDSLKKKAIKGDTPAALSGVNHVFPSDTPTTAPCTRSKSAGTSRTRTQETVPFSSKGTEPGATAARARPTPPLPARATNARPRSPPPTPWVVGRFPAPPLAPGAVAALPTARSAAAPLGVGPTDRKGPCPHSEPARPLPPPDPPRGSERSANARDPTAGAAELPLSRRASGEVASAGGAERKNLQLENRHRPREANCRHWAAIFFGGVPVLAGLLFLLDGLSWLLRGTCNPSTSLSTSPPLEQKALVRLNEGTGGIENVKSDGGGTIGGRTCCANRMRSWTHRQRSSFSISLTTSRAAEPESRIILLRVCRRRSADADVKAASIVATLSRQWRSPSLSGENPTDRTATRAWRKKQGGQRPSADGRPFLPPAARTHERQSHLSRGAG